MTMVVILKELATEKSQLLYNDKKSKIKKDSINL